MENFRFKRKLCCAATTGLMCLFVVNRDALYATNGSGPGSDGPATTVYTPQDGQDSKIGTTAPAFTLTSINNESISLNDFAYRYVVLNFWQSSVPECRKINGAIAELEEKYKDADITFISISLDDNRENWQTAVNRDGLKGPQLSELKKTEDAAITRLYGVTTLPAIYIINPDGKIISIDNGEVDLFKKLKNIFGI
jgi:peroxiredoxin